VAGDHFFGHGCYDTDSTFGSATMRNPANDIGLRYHADGFAIRFTNDDELDMQVRERLCRIDQKSGGADCYEPFLRLGQYVVN
jgi:hypothetical protein